MMTDRFVVFKAASCKQAQPLLSRVFHRYTGKLCGHMDVARSK